MQTKLFMYFCMKNCFGTLLLLVFLCLDIVNTTHLYHLKIAALFLFASVSWLLKINENCCYTVCFS